MRLYNAIMKTYRLYVIERLVIFAFELYVAYVMVMPPKKGTNRIVGYIFCAGFLIAAIYSGVKIVFFVLDLFEGVQREQMLYVGLNATSRVFEEMKYSERTLRVFDDDQWLYGKFTFARNGDRRNRITLRGTMLAGTLKEYEKKGAAVEVSYFRRSKLIKKVI